MERMIGEQLRRFVYQNFLVGEDFLLGDSDSLMQNGVIDSMGVLELVAFLQETYGITIENEELIPENLDTLENLRTYVAHKLNGRDSRSLVPDLREQV